MDVPASPHLNPPRQSRSRRTLERIVDAALDLIEEEGIEGATVAAIVERSGSSVGSFYARFEGKNDLLRYLEERVWREAGRRWDAAVAEESWSELTLEGLVASVVRLLVGIQREGRRARRALGRDGGRDDLGDEARRFHDRVETEVAALVLERRDAIGHPDPELAAGLVYRLAVGAIEELFRGGGQERAADEVVRALTAYLGAEVGEAPEGADVEFFDVWQ